MHEPEFLEEGQGFVVLRRPFLDLARLHRRRSQGECHVMKRHLSQGELRQTQHLLQGELVLVVHNK